MIAVHTRSAHKDGTAVQLQTVDAAVSQTLKGHAHKVVVVTRAVLLFINIMTRTGL